MTEELQELEPLEEPKPVAETPEVAGPVVAPPMSSGLAAPAYNPAADKQYFRFLMSGVLMFLGCLMPFGPEWGMAGYKTLGGAFTMFVAIGMIWSWWGAISTNRFRGANLKWVALAILPMIFQIVNMLGAFEAPAVKDFIAVGKPMPADWSEFFSMFFDVKNAESQLKAGNFVRAFGSGKFLVLIGALLAELSMLMAIFGGAKTAKAQKAQKASGATRRRR